MLRTNWIIGTVVLSIFAVCSIGIALTSATSERALNEAYHDAFKSEASIADLNHQSEAKFQLAATTEPRLEALGTLMPGERIVVVGTSGERLTLEVTLIRLLPADIVTPKIPGARMQLATLKVVDRPDLAPVHMLIEDKTPEGPPSSGTARPL